MKPWEKYAAPEQKPWEKYASSSEDTEDDPKERQTEIHAPKDESAWRRLASQYGSAVGENLGWGIGTALTRTPWGGAFGAGIGRTTGNVGLEALGIDRTVPKPSAREELDALDRIRGEGRLGSGDAPLPVGDTLLGPGASGPRTFMEHADEAAGAASRALLGDAAGAALGKGAHWATTRFSGPETQAAQTVIDAQAGRTSTDPIAAQNRRDLEALEGRMGISPSERTAGMHPDPRMQALARERTTANVDVASKEAERAKNLRFKAVEHVEDVIPRVNQDRLFAARDALTEYNANVRQAGEDTIAAARAQQSTTAEAADAAAQATQRQVQTEVAGLEGAMPQRVPDVQAGGRGVQGRVEQMKDSVSQEFNRLYEPYTDVGSAPTADIEGALKRLKAIAKDEGTVLANFTQEGDTIISRLAQDIDPGDGAVALFPEDMALGQWRGLKNELFGAAENAANAGKFNLSRRLKETAELAKAGEDQAALSLGAEEAEKYFGIRSAYEPLYVDPFRRGYTGEMLKPKGKELGGKSVPSGRVTRDLFDLDNADSLMQAAGAEIAVKQGRSLEGLTPVQLQELGRGEARQMFQPYFEGVLLEKYRSAGGGVKGANAVNKYLQSAEGTLVREKYGIDVSPFEGNTRRIRDIMEAAENSGVQVANDIAGITAQTNARTAEQVLGETDPTKIARFVFDNENPTAALKKLQNISPDPQWQETLKGLFRNELRETIEAKGAQNIFGARTGRGFDAETMKIREVLPQIYTRQELRTLKDYHDMIRKIETPPTKGRVPAPPSADGTSIARRAVSAAPVRALERVAYTTKRAIIAVIDGMSNARTDTVNAYIDDYLIDPKRAKEIMDAWRGSRTAQRRLADKMNQVDERLLRYETTGRAGTQSAMTPLKEGETDADPTIFGNVMGKTVDWGKDRIAKDVRGIADKRGLPYLFRESEGFAKGGIVGLKAKYGIKDLPPGIEEDGYIFTGGDPKVQANWRRK